MWVAFSFHSKISLNLEGTHFRFSLVFCLFVCLVFFKSRCLLEDQFLFTNINRCPLLLFGLSPHDWVLDAV